MLFNSLEYFLFFALFFVAYWLLKGRARLYLLLLGSYFFYSCWDWRFLSLILISTGVDYFAGRAIGEAAGDNRLARKKFFLWLSVGSNLGILCFFKYFGFFVSSFRALLVALGFEASDSTLDIVLPVGISFYTFQTMSYTIDVYRGKIEPERDFLSLAVFVAYFPQLVAGPIERAVNLLPQFRSDRIIDWVDVREGLTLILFGLFRKVVIADSAGGLVDIYFKSPKSYSSLELACALVLYGIQIYSDFAGYSNIARGSSRLLGIRLMRNFDHPYFVTNVSEFWRRWHISLSTWLRDYLYVSLGGNRHGKIKTVRNLMITMLLGGLWHGAGWNFVIWGGLHGLYLVVYHYGIRGRFEESKGRIAQVISHLLSGVFTFVLINFTWLFFRSPSFELTKEFLGELASGRLTGVVCLVPVMVLTFFVWILDLPQKFCGGEYFLGRIPAVPRGLFIGLLIVLILLGGAKGYEPFIYFQF